MPFQYILANLLAELDEATAVLFVDDEGETVDIAVRPGNDVDFRLTGAYLGIYVRRVVSLAAETELGRPRLLYIERPGMTILACALSGGYSVALIQEGTRAVARSTWSLLRAATDLESEVLNEIEK